MFQILKLNTAQDRLYAFIGLSLMLIGLFGFASDVLAHGIATGDKGYVSQVTGVHAIPFTGADLVRTTADPDYQKRIIFCGSTSPQHFIPLLKRWRTRPRTWIGANALFKY